MNYIFKFCYNFFFILFLIFHIPIVSENSAQIFRSGKIINLYEAYPQSKKALKRVIMTRYDIILIFMLKNKYYAQITKIEFSGQKSKKSHFDSLVLLVLGKLLKKIIFLNTIKNNNLSKINRSDQAKWPSIHITKPNWSASKNCSKLHSPDII
ncbi:hypothetical protein BpHYR1_025950 [Brachionus plicatilis]|uniref:Uncharacterized protein n=1 Tax=Brachionus plicatilis TaxID=10195 RepID=A0A3M7SMC6_BRAPC|nr:hypothetical protein BpHYR1_025950 [Brachionus plicatilis]